MEIKSFTDTPAKKGTRFTISSGENPPIGSQQEITSEKFDTLLNVAKVVSVKRHHARYDVTLEVIA